MSKQFGLFVSCEHGGNRVPDAYRPLFADQRALLDSHRGYDIGILPFAERIAAHFDAPLLASTVTRLVVDLNRSLTSRTLFSDLTRNLPKAVRQHILQHYHRPYWHNAEAIVTGIIADGRKALHLSLHSFTPELDGRQRNADLGLLYDPRRPAEKSLCLKWQQTLANCCPELRVRRNYPYRGNADALVTALRKKFGRDEYLGIELEINQHLPLAGSERWRQLQETLLAVISG